MYSPTAPTPPPSLRGAERPLPTPDASPIPSARSLFTAGAAASPRMAPSIAAANRSDGTNTRGGGGSLTSSDAPTVEGSFSGDAERRLVVGTTAEGRSQHTTASYRSSHYKRLAAADKKNAVSLLAEGSLQLQRLPRLPLTRLHTFTSDVESYGRVVRSRRQQQHDRATARTVAMMTSHVMGGIGGGGLNISSATGRGGGFASAGNSSRRLLLGLNNNNGGGGGGEAFSTSSYLSIGAPSGVRDHLRRDLCERWATIVCVVGFMRIRGLAAEAKALETLRRLLIPAVLRARARRRRKERMMAAMEGLDVEMRTPDHRTLRANAAFCRWDDATVHAVIAEMAPQAVPAGEVLARPRGYSDVFVMGSGTVEVIDARGAVVGTVSGHGVVFGEFSAVTAEPSPVGFRAGPSRVLVWVLPRRLYAQQSLRNTFSAHWVVPQPPNDHSHPHPSSRVSQPPSQISATAWREGQHGRPSLDPFARRRRSDAPSAISAATDTNSMMAHVFGGGFYGNGKGPSHHHSHSHLQPIAPHSAEQQEAARAYFLRLNASAVRHQTLAMLFPMSAEALRCGGDPLLSSLPQDRLEALAACMRPIALYGCRSGKPSIIFEGCGGGSGGTAPPPCLAPCTVCGGGAFPSPSGGGGGSAARHSAHSSPLLGGNPLFGLKQCASCAGPIGFLLILRGSVAAVGPAAPPMRLLRPQFAPTRMSRQLDPFVFEGAPRPVPSVTEAVENTIEEAIRIKERETINCSAAPLTLGAVTEALSANASLDVRTVGPWQCVGISHCFFDGGITGGGEVAVAAGVGGGGGAVVEGYYCSLRDAKYVLGCYGMAVGGGPPPSPPPAKRGGGRRGSVSPSAANSSLVASECALVPPTAFGSAAPAGPSSPLPIATSSLAATVRVPIGAVGLPLLRAVRSAAASPLVHYLFTMLQQRAGSHALSRMTTAAVAESLRGDALLEAMPSAVVAALAKAAVPVWYPIGAVVMARGQDPPSGLCSAAPHSDSALSGEASDSQGVAGAAPQSARFSLPPPAKATVANWTQSLPPGTIIGTAALLCDCAWAYGPLEVTVATHPTSAEASVVSAPPSLAGAAPSGAPSACKGAYAYEVSLSAFRKAVAEAIPNVTERQRALSAAKEAALRVVRAEPFCLMD